MSSDDLAGVVLVAGTSERMGEAGPKQLLPFGQRTMAGLTVAGAEASLLDRVVVVTGLAAERVMAGLTRARAIVVHNPRFTDGNVTSLLRGVEAAGDVGAILLLLGDMPGVTPEVINRFVEVWREARPWAAVAVYDDGIPNHPFLLSADAVGAMTRRATLGSKVLWQLLVEAPPRPVAEVRFDRAAPVDVDTPADYQAALRQLGLAAPAD